MLFQEYLTQIKSGQLQTLSQKTTLMQTINQRVNLDNSQFNISTSFLMQYNNHGSFQIEFSFTSLGSSKIFCRGKL